jgi:ABC-2 type transport system ATP-binding protein
MRTKLALLLALARGAELLVLDEPTAGLDPVARREFNDMVASMAVEYGTTVFLSSHLVDDVEEIATRVGIVQAGRASIEGRVDELRERVRRIRAAVPLEPPPGFARVRADVWQADGTLWSTASWPEGTRVEPLPLEEIFLAFARTDPPTTAAA